MLLVCTCLLFRQTLPLWYFYLPENILQAFLAMVDNHLDRKMEHIWLPLSDENLWSSQSALLNWMNLNMKWRHYNIRYIRNYLELCPDNRPSSGVVCRPWPPTCWPPACTGRCWSASDWTARLRPEGNCHTLCREHSHTCQTPDRVQ